jgi:T6SS, Phospholipase effector Tle1-like, catalytic domain
VVVPIDLQGAGMTTPTTPSKRNLVVCLDGTNNGPETGATNVARIFDIAQKNDDQLAYYDPGVGTMGARGAVTRLGQAATRVAGLVAGGGIKDNIEEAYVWLSQRYQKGDQIYVFGFSRGAYTARALPGDVVHRGAQRCRRRLPRRPPTFGYRPVVDCQRGCRRSWHRADQDGFVRGQSTARCSSR